VFPVTNLTAATLTLSSAYYGRTVLVNTNAAVAITLPANGAAAGSYLVVAVHSAANDSCAPTVATATADTLVFTNGTDADSVTFGSGHRIGAAVKFWRDGSFWHYQNVGPTTLTVNDSD
jgi:hypothetical protein